jgi:hypothetical protein
MRDFLWKKKKTKKSGLEFLERTKKTKFESAGTLDQLN